MKRFALPAMLLPVVMGLVTYGSGYQQWNKLNPAKDVYDWSGLEELLDALTAHNMGYALRVFPHPQRDVQGRKFAEILLYI